MGAIHVTTVIFSQSRLRMLKMIEHSSDDREVQMAATKRNGHRGARGPDDLVGRYLTEIGQYPLLTAAEEVELAQQIEDGKEASERLAKREADIAEGRVPDKAPSFFEGFFGAFNKK